MDTPSDEHLEPLPEPGAEPLWVGQSLVDFAVGDPGRAASASHRAISRPFGRPDTVVDGGVVGPLVVRAASTRGRSHRWYGTTRQDSYALGTGAAERWLILAVADGVSEGDLSEIGSEVAARDGVLLIEASLAEHGAESIPWSLIFKTVARRMLATARARISGPDEPDGQSDESLATEVASTAMYTIVDTIPDEEGSFDAHTVRIGDGSLWVLRHDLSLENAFEVKNVANEIASSATTALPYVPEAVHPVSVRLSPGDALFAMTDGVGDPLGDGNNAVGHFLREVWCEPPQPLTFAGHVDFARKSFDDDRTVVGVWVPPSPPSARGENGAELMATLTPTAVTIPADEDGEKPDLDVAGATSDSAADSLPEPSQWL